MASETSVLLSLNAASKLFNTSRTGFFRFRQQHRIRVLSGRRVHGHDIIAAFEQERGKACDPLAINIAVEAYAKKLLTIPEAAVRYGWSVNTFWRFRRKHYLPTLSFGRIHEEDISMAIDKERNEGR